MDRRMNRRGYRRRENRFKIEGEIWFGNKFFHFPDIRERAGREEVKYKFVEKAMDEVRIENFSLFIDKYIPIIDAKIEDTQRRRNEPWLSIEGKSIEEESKKIFLDLLIERTEDFEFEDFSERLKELTQKINSSLIKNQHYKEIICKSFTTQSRLVIGLGSSHVLETSLTLHHVYGIPYIPGSALKGVCRAVAFWELAEKKNILDNQEEIKALQKRFYGELSNDKDILTYQLLFGAQDFKGLLLFLDAYPEINENTKIFELDIMNVHYQSYYAGKGEPGDWENPVPIYFLTVKPGIKFNICVLFDNYRWDKVKDKEPYSKVKDKVENLIKSQSQQENIEQLIQEALNKFGIGAKTRLGYGILE